MPGSLARLQLKHSPFQAPVLPCFSAGVSKALHALLSKALPLKHVPLLNSSFSNFQFRVLTFCHQPLFLVGGPSAPLPIPFLPSATFNLLPPRDLDEGPGEKKAKKGPPGTPKIRAGRFRLGPFQNA